ncbi:sulfurtransferase complex subunit TusB [Musicola keenii]|uniref:sulfurtransferase complex subunit TusB n=1 Tax=Musicola keenii TaxID=2884250 RepID=UPI00177AEE4E|nr:sulfurtransferase complex subunit TusB [Musicola keenii]
MLHTFSHSPYQTDIDALLDSLGAGDALLLLQDGVIAALGAASVLSRLQQSGARVYALQSDIDARGLGNQISTEIQLIDYTEFVQLTVKHARQLAW